MARENDRVRKTILRVATEEFMDRGYDNARVADIIRKAGVTSQVFYAHFPSKVELLIESFRTFVSWNLAFVEPEAAVGGRRRTSAVAIAGRCQGERAWLVGDVGHPCRRTG